MNPEKLKIRRARKEDINDILSLLTAYRQFYRKPSESIKLNQFISERLKRDESVIFLAYLNNQPVGIAQLYRNFSTLSLGKIYILNDLYIKKDNRGQGIGKQLIDIAIHFATAEGAIRVDLKTEHDNLAAQAMYQKYGFKSDETFQHFQYPLATFKK